MIYRDFQNLKLSALGMGCMRLPERSGSYADIDEEAVQKMLAFAMERGVNYYDTAWGYHDGNSELVMGRLLAGYPRESFHLATKFPGYDLANMNRVEEIFERQLEKCGVEYFDFYLFHNVCEMNIEHYLDPKYRIFEHLMEQKARGRIRHLGFSVHGSLETMQRFLDAYGEHMEFCQVQLNWFDWVFQNARAKLAVLKERNIPVWVMEPLRGGNLIKSADKHKEALQKLHPGRTVAEWSYRFLQSFENVVVTLSGASSLAQLQENIRAYETWEPLSEPEMRGLLAVGEAIIKDETLPCTACRYCTAHCPQGLDIPHLLSLYNELLYSGGFMVPRSLRLLPPEKLPAACISCHACEAVCPQRIKIAEAMTDFAAVHENHLFATRP